MLRGLKSHSNKLQRGRFVVEATETTCKLQHYLVVIPLMVILALPRCHVNEGGFHNWSQNSSYSGQICSMDWVYIATFFTRTYKDSINKHTWNHHKAAQTIQDGFQGSYLEQNAQRQRSNRRRLPCPSLRELSSRKPDIGAKWCKFKCVVQIGRVVYKSTPKKIVLIGNVKAW